MFDYAITQRYEHFNWLKQDFSLLKLLDIHLSHFKIVKNKKNTRRGDLIMFWKILLIFKTIVWYFVARW